MGSGRWFWYRDLDFGFVVLGGRGLTVRNDCGMYIKMVKSARITSMSEPFPDHFSPQLHTTLQ